MTWSMPSAPMSLEAGLRIAAAEQPAEPRLPFLGPRRLPADFDLVPARPTDLGGVGALARGRHRAAVDHQDVAVGVEAELRLDPGALPRRDIFVPDRRRLDHMAVAIEHRKILGCRHGCLRAAFREVSIAVAGNRAQPAAGYGRCANASTWSCSRCSGPSSMPSSSRWRTVFAR